VPAGHASARVVVLRELHAQLAKQLLEEPAEDLLNCGLGFKVQPATSGYYLTVSGYSQHLDTMLFQVIETLLRPTFGPAEFARAHRQVLDSLEDTTRQAPYELALGELSALTNDMAFSREERLAALRALDEHALREYLSALTGSGLRAQLLAVGNINEADGRALAARVAERVAKLAGGLLPKEASQRPRVLNASKPLELRMRNPIRGDKNHATVATYQYGVASVAERVRILLLGMMLQDPVFDGLRTKRQLGYVVFGHAAEEANVLELQVLVQGAKEDPDRVEADIESVIDDFEARLKALRPEEFLLWRASLRSSLTEKDQNMDQEAGRYWGQIVSDAHCFNRRELALRYLETLDSVGPVVETFELLRRNNRKVSVKLFGGGADPHSAGPPKPGGGLATRAAAVEVGLPRAEGAGAGAAGGARVAGALSFYSPDHVCHL